MLSVQEAVQEILAGLSPLPEEIIPLHAARGRTLAQTITAPLDVPAFDNSSVDGFALCAADTASTEKAPITLRVVADIAAGSAPQVIIQPGQAARIMTGAAMPAGADAVVMVEDTDFGVRDAGVQAPAHVQVRKTIRKGENVRPQGMDLRLGQPVLAPGRSLGPAELGLLAMLGLGEIPVYRQPRVALLSSGDELVAPGQPLSPGKIYDSNSITLSALLESAGARVISLGVARDEQQDVEQRLAQAVTQQADLIISSAGVSVGAFDYVKSAVESHGSLDFWRVNIRPGKPLAYGKYQGIPFFGLPGNPVSSYVGFEVFVRPALARLSGASQVQRKQVSATLQEPIESDGRESYLRAIITENQGEYTAHFPSHQGSGNLYSLVLANALLIIPSGVKSLAPGDKATAWLLDV